MKILFINPWEGEIFPPPSIGYLQAAIKEARPDIQVKAADFTTAMVLLNNYEYDLVAVTYHSFSVKYAKIIRSKVRGKLICGGHHPTALPQQMLEIGYDQVVIGEGEKAILDIINGETKKIYNCERIQDIDSIAYPDYTGLEWDGIYGFPIISSRGCPFDCNFCASSIFWGRKWKGRSADNIYKEIVQRIEIDKVASFMFEDDNFTLIRERVIEICKLIKGLNTNWQCASRAETLQDEDLCRKLKESGCHTVWLGIESLSQGSLDRCNKKTTVQKMLKGIEVIVRSGLLMMPQFIVGLPGDTIKDIKETARNIRRSKITNRGVNKAWVLPGTKIYEQAKKYGFDDDDYLISGAPFYTYEQNINTLNNWRNLILKA